MNKNLELSNRMKNYYEQVSKTKLKIVKVQ